MELLKPLLDTAANQAVPNITTMDSAFKAAGTLAEKQYAAFLISRLERMALKFTSSTVQATEAPVIIPI